MYKANTAQVMTDAAQIARRFRDHRATITGLQREYESSYAVIKKAILSQMSKSEYRRIAHHALLGTRFRPGHAAWNKDLKGTHFSPQSEFKTGGPLRGFAARLWRPIGTVTIRHDLPFLWQKRRRGPKSTRGKARRWIKVKDDGRLQDRWVPYALYLWEKRNGPVPDGLIVVHKDGNQMHDVIDNLIIVNRRRHIFRTCHNKPDVMARAHKRAGESRKKNTPARRAIRGLVGPQRMTWHCPACGATYEQLAPPARCIKCSAASFERLTIPRFG
jgi:hypothetical protein